VVAVEVEPVDGSQSHLGPVQLSNRDRPVTFRIPGALHGLEQGDDFRVAQAWNQPGLSAGACRVQGNIAGIAFGRAAAAVETAEPAQ
jgi:hypothetical protein